MANLYPRRHTFLIFVACVVVVIGIYFYVNGIDSGNPSGATDKNTILADQTPILSNNNWQKEFFEATSSGAYKAKPITTANLSSSSETLTATDILGRNFFTKYAQLRQAGLTNDPNAVNDAVNSVISQSLSTIQGPKTYSFTDIKVVPDQGNAALQSYAQNLMNILKSAMPAQNEAEIAMNAFDKNDMTLLKGIDPIITGYRTTLKGLLALPVPQSLAPDHLNLINGINAQIFNAESLRKSDSDPVTGLAAVSMEVKGLETISGAVGDMQVYFSKAGVVFVPPVSGSILQSR